MGNLGPNATVSPPTWDLLDANLLAVAQAPVDPAGSRWEMGLQFVPDPGCGVGGTWVPCTDAELPPPGSNPAAVEHMPISIVAAYTCSTFGMGDGTGDGFRANARTKLDANRARLTEHEFWTGDAARSDALPNRWLAPTAADLGALSGPGQQFENFVDLSPGAPTGLLVSFVELQQFLATCSGIKGAIHLTVRAASLLYALGAIGWRGNRLVDVVGNTIVVGSGYDGTGPTTITPGLGGTEWLYATGPVAARLGSVQVVPDTIGEAVDRRTNDATFYASRLVAVTWDGCCHAGIEALAEVCGTP